MAGSKLIIHWGSFINGMAYVMLGRCQKLEDIHIVGKFDKSQIKCDPNALEMKYKLDFKDQLRSEKLANELRNSFVISFVNVNRLFPHLPDVLSDHILLNSDVFGLAETWLENEEQIIVDDFKGFFHNVRKGQGTAAFVKNKIHCEVTRFSQVGGENISEKISGILVNTEKVDIIFLYLSKHYIWNDLKTCLERWIPSEKPAAILGDLNWNYLESFSNPMKEYLLSKDFKQLVNEPTHDAGNLIDHAYVNQELLKLNVTLSKYCIEYSDHDILQIKFPL